MSFASQHPATSPRSLWAIVLFFWWYALMLLVLFAVHMLFPWMIVWLEKAPLSMSHILFYFLLFILQSLVFLFVLWCSFLFLSYWKQVNTYIVSYIKARRKRLGWWMFWRCVWWWLLIYVATAAIVSMVFDLLGISSMWLNGEQVVFSILDAIAFNRRWEYALLLCMVAVLAPIIEELIYRWFVTDVLMRHWWWRGVVASAIVFAWIHMDPGVMINLLILSLVLGYIYWKTDSLIYPIVFHILINSLWVSAILFA